VSRIADNELTFARAKLRRSQIKVSKIKKKVND
jgi:hypothetical protein